MGQAQLCPKDFDVVGGKNKIFKIDKVNKPAFCTYELFWIFLIPN